MNKKNRVGLIFCAAAFVVMILYMIFVDGVDNLVSSIGKMQPLFLLLAVGCIVVYWLLEAMTVQAALKSLHPRQRFGSTFKITVIGQYFNCITPCASGGQPFQAYYLVKDGVSLSSAMTALLARFIVYQFALTVWSAVLLILRFSYFITELRPLMLLTIVGFLVNLAVIVALFMLAFFNKLAVKISHAVLKLLHKLRLVKNYDEKLEYIDGEIRQYTDNFGFMKKQPALILKMLLYSSLQLLVYFSVSYVLYLGFGLSGADYLTVLSCQAFVLMISSFVPLPGALGAAEGSYAAFFIPIFGSFTALSTFIWRVLTFYIPIASGLALTLYLNRKSKSENVEKHLA